METYIADEHGHVDVPGVQAVYPPGTKVFYQNGEYAGHESPILEEVPPVETTGDTQPLPTLQGEAPTQVEGEQSNG